MELFEERRLSKRQRGQKWVPWRGCFGKFGFHGVEKPGNLGSMAWKIGEFDFHGVELFAAQGKTTTLQAGGAWRRGGEGIVAAQSIGEPGTGN